MFRFAMTVFCGVAIGIFLVLAIGVARMKTKLPPGAEPAVLDRSVMTMQRLLLAEGYETGTDLTIWTRSNRRALQRYLNDWDLPYDTSRETEYSLTDDVQARLRRTHPATRPQLIESNRENCKVWSARPRPRESVTWTGLCEEGVAVGTGNLVFSYTYYGKDEQDFYSGPLVQGRMTGFGTSRLGNGMKYEGDHLDGVFQGRGNLDFPDRRRYEGQFADGLPHGEGTFYGVSQTYRGLWTQGCLKTPTQRMWVLRTARQCGFKDGVLDFFNDVQSLDSEMNRLVPNN